MAATRVTQGAPRPTSLQIWMMAARPKTLPAGIAPVLVGTALAGYLHVFHPLRFVAALLGSVLTGRRSGFAREIPIRSRWAGGPVVLGACIPRARRL